MTSPVINTVIKSAPDLSTNWVEGTDFGWFNAGTQTNSTSFVDMAGSTSDGDNDGQGSLNSNQCYYASTLILNHQIVDAGYIAYCQAVWDGVVKETHSTASNVATTFAWTIYGGQNTYSIQDEDYGSTQTLAATTVAKFQARSSISPYWCYNKSSLSWFLKSKADTLFPDKISCCNKSASGQNSGRMYVDSFTFICHGEGTLTSSGLSRYNNNTNYFPTHQVKNVIGSLSYSTGGTSYLFGDYAIFIEGVFLVMT